VRWVTGLGLADARPLRAGFFGTWQRSDGALAERCLIVCTALAVLYLTA